MTGLVFVLCVLATFWCFSRPAAASVYPTKPTQTTIYQAGAPAEVLWIEDNRRPFLNLTGLMQIDLYEGNSVSSSPWTNINWLDRASNFSSCHYPSKHLHDRLRHIWQLLQRTWIHSRCRRRSTSRHRLFRRITTRCKFFPMLYISPLRTAFRIVLYTSSPPSPARRSIPQISVSFRTRSRVRRPQSTRNPVHLLL